jgi:hypothetical protein
MMTVSFDGGIGLIIFARQATKHPKQVDQLAIRSSSLVKHLFVEHFVNQQAFSS